MFTKKKRKKYTLYLLCRCFVIIVMMWLPRNLQFENFVGFCESVSGIFSILYTISNKMKWWRNRTNRTRSRRQKKSAHNKNQHNLSYTRIVCCFISVYVLVLSLPLYLYIHISLFTLILLWPFWVLFFAFAPYIRQNTLSLLSEYSLKFKLFFLLSFLVGNWISSKKKTEPANERFSISYLWILLTWIFMCKAILSTSYFFLFFNFWVFGKLKFY